MFVLLGPHRFVFDGDEKVEVSVVEQTSTITLHIKELLIKGANFVASDGTTIETLSMSEDLKLHTLTFTFASPLPIGKSRSVLSLCFCCQQLLLPMSF